MELFHGQIHQMHQVLSEIIKKNNIINNKLYEKKTISNKYYKNKIILTKSNSAVPAPTSAFLSVPGAPGARL